MRTFLIALISIACLLPALPAAADTIPQFDANRHVYIDPTLADRLKVSPAQLEADIASKLNYPGTNYYLVGLKTDSTARRIGVDAANSIIKNWQLNPALPLRNRVLVVWASSTGDGHNGMGINLSPDVLLDRSSVDVKKILQTYMPLHPDQALLATVASIDLSLSRDAFMIWLVPILVLSVLSFTLARLLSEFGVFRQLRSTFEAVRLKITSLLDLPTRSQELVTAFRADLLAASVEVSNLDLETSISFYCRLNPDHPRWSKLATQFRTTAECLLFANSKLTAAVALLASHDYAGVAESLGPKRQQFDFSDGSQLTIAPARICHEIRDRARAIRRELSLYESGGNCWPEDKPVAPVIEVAPSPTIPKPEWPAQSPVYIASNDSGFNSNQVQPQPNVATYRQPHYDYRSGSTRTHRSVRSGSNDQICERDSFARSDDRSSQSSGSDASGSSSFGSDELDPEDLNEE